jgi:Cu2+-exporting ATPase
MVTPKDLGMALITLGVGAAVLWSLFGLLFPGALPDMFKTSGSVHLYFESATVILTLVLLGQVMELAARKRTTSAIKELIQLRPEVALVRRNNQEQIIPLESVLVGDLVIIKPGNRIPVDGSIREGHTEIDESMMTGEPLPVYKTTGDSVVAGTLNTSGSFEMEAERVGADTLLSRIIEIVNSASRTRAPIQSMADRIASYFVPTVVIVSILTFFAWSWFGPEPAVMLGFVNAIAVLIVACPCALGLATPMSVTVGAGKGASMGILIKNASVIEEMREIDTLIVDKTGTLTHGHPSLEEIVPWGDTHTVEELLQLAASVESRSSHPIGIAITDAARNTGVDILKVKDFISVLGKGITASVDSRIVGIGSEAHMDDLEVKIPVSISDLGDTRKEQGKTVMHMSVQGSYAAMICIADTIKENAKEVMHELTSSGIVVIMMTGDDYLTARHVAQEVGIEHFEWRCSPTQKLHRIENLQADGKKVAMAGDGINDSPALAKANVGIAMGTGSDTAIENSDITLVKGDIEGILKTRRLSVAVIQNIRQNLFFAFLYNTLGIPVAAGILFPFIGMLMSPMVAALAMSFSSVSVIANSLRLRSQKI